jgi:type IV pilus assembly protein PilM
VEITSSRVSAASLDWRGGQPAVSAHASEPLPDGALVPSLTATNAQDRPAVVAALSRLFEQVGRPRRIGLIIPDSVAKVSIVRFEQVPARVQDLDQLVRWQVRKSAPFAIERRRSATCQGSTPRTARVHRHAGEALGHSGIRAVVRRCRRACGLVDLATLNVINAVLAGRGAPSGDWLLVNIAADYTSIALLRGPNLIFFRNRAADTDGTLADLVHQSAMYYEDRLKAPGSRASSVRRRGGRRASDGQHRPAAAQPRGSTQDSRWKASIRGRPRR